MARLPDSRRKTEILLQDAAPYRESIDSFKKTFVDHSLEGLKTTTSLEPRSAAFTEVVFPSVSNRSRQLVSATSEPLVNTKRIGEWLCKSGACLHCGHELSSGEDKTTIDERTTMTNAVPIAKYKLDGLYWVFGQFCSAPCALGYVQEHTMGPQVMTWTRTMLSTVFDVKEPMTVAPPRFMLQRYGGPLSSDTWKRTAFFVLKEPPLCTFAMYAECKRDVASLTQAAATDLLRGLRRPVERDTEPAKSTVTGREPVVLRLLAEEQSPSPKRTAVKKQFAPGAAPKKPRQTAGLDCFLASE